LLERDPERAGQASAAVSAAGREAPGVLRQPLQVLGSGDVAAPRVRTSTADDIDLLLERVRSAGQRVELRVAGEPRTLA